MNDVRCERLGMLVARMHNVGAPSDAANRLRLNGTTYVREHLQWMSKQGVIPEHFAGRYATAAGAIADEADALLEGVVTHRIHGDFHLGNIIEREGLFHVLDFDDMVIGPAVQDFWLVLPGRDKESERLREIFVSAYEQLRDFDRSTLRLIEPLRGLRMVHYSAWIARRWHDPAFPATWPHFGTDQYWSDATTDLEELLVQIQTGVYEDDEEGQEESGEETAEEVLTNKDYFWDWEED
jgi:Ser/Thr protein kinase RdoA (MazF antagonist)